jgi:tetratricopeptide (TPR) repeat protein
MLSCALTDAGRADEALRAREELVARRRDLVARHPDVFEPGLAEALRNLAIDLNGLGRREEALAARAEAIAITERLGER